MATFTAYWPEWMCTGAVEAGFEGQPMPVLFGGQSHELSLYGTRIAPGDVVVVITCRAGVLHALFSLQVTQRLGRDHREPLLLRRWHGCTDDGWRGVPGAPLRFDRPLTAQQQTDWRFDPSSAPRLLKYLDENRRVRAASAEGVRQVSEQTAAMLEEVLRARPPESASTDAGVLEARLRAAPDDETTARVLADAWQAEGDPRGELLSLELALRRERDVEAAMRIDARLSELARRSPRLKKKAGGFPFRPTWGTRPIVELRASLELDALRPWQALERAQRYVAADGFGQVMVTTREHLPEFERLMGALGAAYVPALLEPSQSWRRTPGLSAGEIEQCVELAPQHSLFVTASGPLLIPGTQTALPLQAKALWFGEPERSSLEFWVSAHGISSCRARLLVPMGTALAAAAVDALTEELKSARGRLFRRELHRSRRPLPEARRDDRARYSDPRLRAVFGSDASSRWFGPSPI